MKEISLKDAQSVLEDYPKKDWFITANFKLTPEEDGNFTDNGIELSEYWDKCREVIDEHIFVEKTSE